MFSKLTHAICSLVCELSEARRQRNNEFDWYKSHHGFITKHDLEESVRIIMSQISDFLAKQKAFNERQAKAVDSVVTSITGLSEDIVELNKVIKALQDSAGTVTPEDAALIDEAETKGEAIATRIEGAATALAALDSQTPPVVPTPPPA